MGIKLMKNILPVSKLDHCEIYSININYTLTIQKINWVFKTFPQADLDVDVFMDIPLGMGVDKIEESVC